MYEGQYLKKTLDSYELVNACLVSNVLLEVCVFKTYFSICDPEIVETTFVFLTLHGIKVVFVYVLYWCQVIVICQIVLGYYPNKLKYNLKNNF